MRKSRGSASKIEDTAARILSLREHSERELYMKLLKKGYMKEEIETLMEKLKKAGVVNDRRFAILYARLRRKKLYGDRKIMAELLERGVDREIAEDAIKEASKELNEREAAMELAEKKKKKGEKLFRYLIQRGFSIELAREVAGDEDV